MRASRMSQSLANLADAASIVDRQDIQLGRQQFPLYESLNRVPEMFSQNRYNLHRTCVFRYADSAHVPTSLFVAFEFFSMGCPLPLPMSKVLLTMLSSALSTASRWSEARHRCFTAARPAV